MGAKKFAEAIIRIGELQKAYFENLSNNIETIERNIGSGVLLTYESNQKTKTLQCDIGIPKKIIHEVWSPLQEARIAASFEYDSNIGFNITYHRGDYVEAKLPRLEKEWLDKSRIPPTLARSSTHAPIYANISKVLNEGDICIPILFDEKAHEKIEISKRNLLFKPDYNNLVYISSNTVVVEEKDIINELKDFKPRQVNKIRAYLKEISDI